MFGTNQSRLLLSLAIITFSFQSQFIVKTGPLNFLLNYHMQKGYKDLQARLAILKEKKKTEEEEEEFKENKGKRKANQGDSFPWAE